VRGRECVRVAGMIVVLVGNEDRGERRRRNAEIAEPALELFRGEPAIDQQARLARLDDYAVSLRAAAGAGEPNARVPTSAARAEGSGSGER
jgi:hypothetical protein